jgi:hypothetical protein
LSLALSNPAAGTLTSSFAVQLKLDRIFPLRLPRIALGASLALSAIVLELLSSEGRLTTTAIPMRSVRPMRCRKPPREACSFPKRRSSAGGFRLEARLPPCVRSGMNSAHPAANRRRGRTDADRLRNFRGAPIFPLDRHAEPALVPQRAGPLSILDREALRREIDWAASVSRAGRSDGNSNIAAKAGPLSVGCSSPPRRVKLRQHRGDVHAEPGRIGSPDLFRHVSSSPDERSEFRLRPTSPRAWRCLHRFDETRMIRCRQRDLAAFNYANPQMIRLPD